MNHNREQELQKIYREYPITFPILLALVFLIIGVWIGSRLFSQPDSGYNVNIYTEILSVIFTVGILQTFNNHRERMRIKADLIYRMGSTINSEAIRAVEELRRNGWLTDGSLRNAHLPNANLVGADLSDADLSGVNLENANLSGDKTLLNNVDLEGARLGGANFDKAMMENVNMQKAYLVKGRHSPMKQINTGWYMAGSTQYDVATFCGAFLRHTDFRQATMLYTDFENAILDFSNFEGAIVQGINWKGADLINSELRNLSLRTRNEFQFDENTRFPDGETNVPNPLEYLYKFVFPEHPQFWRSPNSISPAYTKKQQ